jgi:hypothetical protein
MRRRVDKSVLAFGTPPLVRDEAWLKELHDHPCVLTFATPCDPSHIRYGLGGGASFKPSDDRVLPLRPDLHRLSHRIGEVRFWREHVTDDLLMASLIAYAEKYYRLRRAP